MPGHWWEWRDVLSGLGSYVSAGPSVSYYFLTSGKWAYYLGEDLSYNFSDSDYQNGVSPSGIQTRNWAPIIFSLPKWLSVCFDLFKGFGFIIWRQHFASGNLWNFLLKIPVTNPHHKSIANCVNNRTAEPEAPRSGL